jgi:hypothetical protein
MERYFRQEEETKVHYNLAKNACIKSCALRFKLKNKELLLVLYISLSLRQA